MIILRSRISDRQEQMHVPIAFCFLRLFFISRFFKSKEEFRRATFRLRLRRGGGTKPVCNTYVVVEAALAFDRTLWEDEDDECLGAAEEEDASRSKLPEDDRSRSLSPSEI